MEQLNFPKSAQCEIVFKFCCETGQLQGAWLEMQVLELTLLNKHKMPKKIEKKFQDVV